MSDEGWLGPGIASDRLDPARRTRQLLLAHVAIIALVQAVVLIMWAGRLYPAGQGLLSTATLALILAYTLAAWLAHRRDPGANWVAPALLYLDAPVGVVCFYILGELETPNSAMIVFCVVMAPMYTRKAHAYGVATVATVTYCGMLLARAAGWIPYYPVMHEVPAAQFADPGFLADVVGGFICLMFGGAFLAGRASLEINQTRAELEAEVEGRTSDLRHRGEELQAAHDRLSEHDRLKTRFFSNVSHELRTPLTLVLGPVEELLEVPDLSEPVRERLRAVLRNARRLLWRINQLLDLTRLDQGGGQISLARVDAVPFIHRRVAAFESLAERRRIRLDFVSDMGQLPAVFDPDRVEQIVFNLVSNALKFTGPGGKVELQAREGPRQLPGARAHRRAIRLRAARGAPVQGAEADEDRLSVGVAARRVIGSSDREHPVQATRPRRQGTVDCPFASLPQQSIRPSPSSPQVWMYPAETCS